MIHLGSEGCPRFTKEALCQSRKAVLPFYMLGFIDSKRIILYDK